MLELIVDLTAIAIVMLLASRGLAYLERQALSTQKTKDDDDLTN